MHIDCRRGGFALRVGQLIDRNGGAPLRGAILQVVDGRIAAIGRAEDFGTAAEHAVDAAAERTLMPGLVDCHAHPTLFPDRQLFNHTRVAAVYKGGERLV